MLLAAVKAVLKPVGAVTLANGTYVIASGGNSPDGGYGTLGQVPYVQLAASNNTTAQFWVWDGTRLSCQRVIQQQFTWNPANANGGTSANVTLSNGNLTGTYNSGTAAYSAGFGIGGANGGITAGKHYWETVLNGVNVANSESSVGIGLNSSAIDNNYLGAVPDTIGYYGTGAIFNNNNNIFGGPVYASGAVVGHALDKDNNKYWVRSGAAGLWLGQAIGSQDPANNVGGISLPSAISSGTVEPAFNLLNNTTPDSVNGRFTVASWAGAAPSGFGPPSSPPNGPFMADNGDGTATENATGDTWTIVGSGGGYTVRSQTGRYLAIVSGALAMSASPFVWTFTAATAQPQITLNPTSVTVQDNAAAHTVLTTATVTMSDGSQFTGTITSSDTSFFEVNGLQIRLAHNLTSADQGTHNTTITAHQGAMFASVRIGVTV